MSAPDLSYELAPTHGMSARQRKADLDVARFVVVRYLAYLRYKKPNGEALMDYQSTLDDRELTKNAIVEYEITHGLLKDDRDATSQIVTREPPPFTQIPPIAISNGATMSQPVPAPQFQPSVPQFQPQMQQPQAPMPYQPQMQQQPQMQYQPQMQQPQAPIPLTQFASVPAAPQFTQPQYSVPQPQQQMQFTPQLQPAQPVVPPMAEATVTGRKRKTASGNAVAPPPISMLVPPGIQPVPQQAAINFQPTQTAPQIPFQPQLAPQQIPTQTPTHSEPSSSDLSPIIEKLDKLGRGAEVTAFNGDSLLKAVTKIQADVDALTLANQIMLVGVHHLYMSLQGVNGQPLLTAATEGKAANLDGFKAHLQKYVTFPK